MSTDQKVVSSAGRSVGGIRAGRGKSGSAPEAEAPKRKFSRPPRKVLIIAVVVLLALAGAAAYALKPAATGADAPVAVPEPVAGEVLTIEAVSVNLVDGHYLRLGLGLQLVESGHEAPDPAKALDLAIALFSGHTVAEVTDPPTRDALKDELATQLSEAYEGEVMDVYLTDFVTQ